MLAGRFKGKGKIGSSDGFPPPWRCIGKSLKPCRQTNYSVVQAFNLLKVNKLFLEGGLPEHRKSYMQERGRRIHVVNLRKSGKFPSLCTTLDIFEGGNVVLQKRMSKNMRQQRQRLWTCMESGNPGSIDPSLGLLVNTVDTNTGQGLYR